MKPELEILKEEFKEAGIEIAEDVLEKAVLIFFEKALPKIAVQSESAAINSICSVVSIIYPIVKPVIEKATDLNKDGV